MIIPLIVKVNNVSSGGEINSSVVNVLLQQDNIQKNNTPVVNNGDASHFILWSPLNDPDVSDTPIRELKFLP
jgi:hypothetical protein